MKVPKNYYAVYRVDVPGQVKEMVAYHSRKYSEKVVEVQISYDAPQFIVDEIGSLNIVMKRRAAILPRDIWVVSDAEGEDENETQK